MQYLKILGTVQDGGYPHPGCFKKCCIPAWENSKNKRLVSSVAVIDDNQKKIWLFDISPDIRDQMYMVGEGYSIEGVFLTHAHFGHYSGLFQLGLEVMNLKGVPVYSMPLMERFLVDNAPINFLIKSKNIEVMQISEKNEIPLCDNVSVIPFQVPHRNELSETVGYRIKSLDRIVVFLPDIDSWEEWDEDVLELIEKSDILILDGTFYSKEEINGRNIKKIPHPSIQDSMTLFNSLKASHRKKVFFTHLNHTNRVIDKASSEYSNVIDLGYNVAEEGQTFTI